MHETLEGTILQAQALSIHGAVFYDLLLQTAEGPRRVRCQDTFLSPPPQAGEKLRLELILGNVSSVERLL
ncbi:hypothetical protein [Calidithermus timidus]|jgi:hypothetical protein|uniref:hypothetical protein n=1 Tax=Calidithermus timidus TaxID=307124 RepID=UPI00037FD2A0|nr:hypothetical protein [Calidithermus timidus]